MSEERMLQDEARSLGWHPTEGRHGWAKAGPDGATQAVVEETDGGYTAAVVGVPSAERGARPGEAGHRWGPEVFESPADAVDAAERHLEESTGGGPSGSPQRP